MKGFSIETASFYLPIKDRGKDAPQEFEISNECEVASQEASLLMVEVVLNLGSGQL